MSAPQGQRGAHAEHGGHQSGLFLAPLKQRIQSEHQRQAQQRPHAHVRRGVDPHVHPGEAHQPRQDPQQRPQPGLFHAPGRAAQGHDGVLAVAAGEGIAPGVRTGALHDGEARVPDPWPGHRAGDLQGLAHHRAADTGGDDVVAVPFVHAPVHDDGHSHEYHLAAQKRDGGEQPVQQRGPQPLQNIQKAHTLTSICNSRLLYHVVRFRRKPGARPVSFWYNSA